MSDVEKWRSRRLEFLRAVYDLADGTTGNWVRGEVVAERLGIDLLDDEFHGLAYFHEQKGNTQALESNWGSFHITAKGIAESERAITPEARRGIRERLLRAIYDLSNGNIGFHVMVVDATVQCSVMATRNARFVSILNSSSPPGSFMSLPPVFGC